MNHPRHYNLHPSGVEAIDILEEFSYNVGAAIGYLWRAAYKGEQIRDLRKAAWHANREADRLQRKQDAARTTETLQSLSRPIIHEETEGVNRVKTSCPPVRVFATELFYYLPEDCDPPALCAIARSELPVDADVVTERTGSVLIDGVAYARSAGAAREAGRNTGMYPTEGPKFDALAAAIDSYRIELQHSTGLTHAGERKG